MNKLKLALIPFILTVISNAAYGDISLQSVKEVEGTWKLHHTTNSLTDKNIIERQDTWVFKDGKVTIQHIPRDGGFYDQPPVNYEIEDGKLKVALVGNSRFDVFTLVEKDSNSMTLKGKFGGYSYFIKK